MPKGLALCKFAGGGQSSSTKHSVPFDVKGRDMRIWQAIRAFFAVLVDREAAKEIREIVDRRRKKPVAAPPPAAVVEQPAIGPPTAVKRPSAKLTKSEALVLLEALQREARFVDFIKEDLQAYSDSQIGAAVRDIQRDCAAVLERFFAIRPVIDVPEGTEYVLQEGFDSGRFRVVGNVQGAPPYRGKVTHHGWEATECRLPVWSGTEGAVRIIAPAELEVSESGIRQT